MTPTLFDDLTACDVITVAGGRAVHQTQTAFDLEPAGIDLTAYDAIVVSTSGGKDSQVMLDEVVRLARAAGVLDRVTAVHADLGRVEWPGTLELAARQVAHYELPEMTVEAKVDTEVAPFDLLDRVRARGMWPDAQNRWCTSDHKRGPTRRYFTAVARAWRAANPDAGRPCRILSCMGLRAQESPKRAKMEPFTPGVVDRSTQVVDEWLPIHGWTEDQVWDRIRATGVEHHPAYDWGMPRLSCSFCVLASRSALVRAAQLRPDLAAEYVAVEVETGHTFQNGTSLAEIVAEAKALGETPVEVAGWDA